MTAAWTSRPPANFGEHQLIYRTGDVVIPRVQAAGAAAPRAPGLRQRDPHRRGTALQRRARPRHRGRGRDGASLDARERRRRRSSPSRRARRSPRSIALDGRQSARRTASIGPRHAFDLRARQGRQSSFPTRRRWTGPWLGATRSHRLQRVANRPIVCHVLDALLRRPASSRSPSWRRATRPRRSPPACRARARPGVEVHSLVGDRRGEGDAALLAAAEFVGDAPCVLHRADGLLGQPLLRSRRALREESLDALLLVASRGESDAPRLRLVPRRLRRRRRGAARRLARRRLRRRLPARCRARCGVWRVRERAARTLDFAAAGRAAGARRRRVRRRVAREVAPLRRRRRWTCST